MKIDSLTIHNHTYSQQSLTEICNTKIRNDDTPSWEKEVYGFILQWLDDSDTIIQYSSGTTGKSKNDTASKTGHDQVGRKYLPVF